MLSAGFARGKSHVFGFSNRLRNATGSFDEFEVVEVKIIGNIVYEIKNRFENSEIVFKSTQKLVLVFFIECLYLYRIILVYQVYSRIVQNVLMQRNFVEYLRPRRHLLI